MAAPTPEAARVRGPRADKVKVRVCAEHIDGHVFAAVAHAEALKPFFGEVTRFALGVFVILPVEQHGYTSRWRARATERFIEVANAEHRGRLPYIGTEE